MAIWHTGSKRKRTSGKFRRNSKKKKAQIGREFAETTLGEHKVVEERVRGGNHKSKLKRSKSVNLNDPDSGETEQVEIKGVVENEANPNFVRRDILTKGTVIETEKGKARITSRPGQNGILNAVLVD